MADWLAPHLKLACRALQAVLRACQLGLTHQHSPSPTSYCFAVKMGAPLRAVLKGLLEPAPEERMSAEEALEVLAGKKSVPARWVWGKSCRGDCFYDKHLTARSL